MPARLRSIGVLGGWLRSEKHMTTLTPKDRANYHLEQKTNSTGFMGVTFKPRDGGFEARIRVPGRKNKVYCGWAKTAEQAARLYGAKARELFGEDAAVNFKPPNAEVTGLGPTPASR